MDYIPDISLAFVAIFSIWTIRDLGKNYLDIIRNRDAQNYLSRNNREGENDNDEDDDDDTIVTSAMSSIIELSIRQEVLENCINYYVRSVDGQLDDNKPPCLIIPVHINIHEIPDEYKCPISKEIMKDPVISSDGHTYEREMITRHMRLEQRSPITSREFLFPYLIPNWNIRKAIQSFIASHPLSESITSTSSRSDGNTNSSDGINTEQIPSNIINSDSSASNSGHIK